MRRHREQNTGKKGGKPKSKRERKTWLGMRGKPKAKWVGNM